MVFRLSYKFKVETICGLGHLENNRVGRGRKVWFANKGEVFELVSWLMVQDHKMVLWHEVIKGKKRRGSEMGKDRKICYVLML